MVAFNGIRHSVLPSLSSAAMRVAAGIAVEENATGGRQYTRHSLAVGRSLLRDLPDDLACLDIERAQIFLPGISRGRPVFQLPGESLTMHFSVAIT